MKKLFYVAFLMVASNLFAMQPLQPDVILRNVINKSGKPVEVEVHGTSYSEGKLTPFQTSRTFVASSEPQQWNKKLKSKKNQYPDTLKIKVYGLAYNASGNTQEIDLILEKDKAEVVPAGSVKMEEQSQLHTMAGPQAGKRSQVAPIVVLKTVENNSHYPALIKVSTPEDPQFILDTAPATTKKINLQLNTGEPIVIFTIDEKGERKSATYKPSGRSEDLRVIVDKQAKPYILEATQQAPKLVQFDAQVQVQPIPKIGHRPVIRP